MDCRGKLVRVDRLGKRAEKGTRLVLFEYTECICFSPYEWQSHYYSHYWTLIAGLSLLMRADKLGSVYIYSQINIRSSSTHTTLIKSRKSRTLWELCLVDKRQIHDIMHWVQMGTLAWNTQLALKFCTLPNVNLNFELNRKPQMSKCYLFNIIMCVM